MIDGRGKFVIPGLVDMHVHVYTPEKWHPEFFLAAGVTTVLDLGGQLHDVAAYRTAVDSGARPGPRILFTGPMLEEGEPYAGFAGFCRRFDSARTEAEVDALADAGVDGDQALRDRATRHCAPRVRARPRARPAGLHAPARDLGRRGRAGRRRLGGARERVRPARAAGLLAGRAREVESVRVRRLALAMAR